MKWTVEFGFELDAQGNETFTINGMSVSEDSYMLSSYCALSILLDESFGPPINTEENTKVWVAPSGICFHITKTPRAYLTSMSNDLDAPRLPLAFSNLFQRIENEI